MHRITGTFLDEITHDIPSQNWGEKEWRQEFELYSKIGIDTVVIIRSGYQNKCIFPCKSVTGLLPVYTDYLRLFLDLAEEFGIGVFVGTFDSGTYWMRNTWWKEVELNKKVIDEIVSEYGDSPAFKGWYLTHETSHNTAHIIELFRGIGSYCKASKDVPVLISPFPQGTKQFSLGESFSLTESMDHWEHIFSDCSDVIDICAFQDGQIQYQELPEFLLATKSLCDKFDITNWSNVESFDRDMPIKFPPADWRYLRLKMEAASQRAEKIITFEFPHFMSPHSCYPAARNLFDRYCEHFGIDLSGDE